MVGHADLGVGFDMAALGGLDGGGLVPLFVYDGACGGGLHGGAGGAVAELGQAGLASRHYEGDEVDAGIVVVMTGIVGTIGGRGCGTHGIILF